LARIFYIRGSQQIDFQAGYFLFNLRILPPKIVHETENPSIS
jgi:hypothetical protein